MIPDNLQFNNDEADEILRRILERKPKGSRFTMSDLEMTASELGISKNELQQAIETYILEKENEELRADFLKIKRRKFYDHLVAFCIVNTAFILTDILITDSGWFKYLLIFWGIGLAFDAWETYFPNDEKVEKGIQKLRKKRKKEGIKFGLNDSTLKDGIKGEANFSIGKDFTVTLSDKGIVWKKGNTTIEF